MNKLYPILLLHLIVLFCGSCCRKSEPAPRTYLEIRPSTLDFATDPQNAVSVNLLANDQWYLTCDQEWLTVSPSNGNRNATLNIKPTRNSGLEMRQAVITVVCNEVKQQITIRQLGERPAILLSQPESYLAAYGGGIATVAVTTNVELETTIDADWITETTASPSSKTMVDYVKSYTAPRYTSQNPRVANVVFKQKGQSLQETFTITQLPSSPIRVIDLYTTIETAAFTACVNAEGAIVNVNPAQEVSDIKVSEPWWIQVILDESSAEQGYATKSAPARRTILFKQNLDKAPRYGYVMFEGVDGRKDTVHFAQIGLQPAIITSFSNALLSAQGGTTILEIMANNDDDVTVVTDAKWLNATQIEQPKKLGQATRFTYTFDAKQTQNINASVATVDIYGNESKLNTKVNIKQTNFGKKSMYLQEKNRDLSFMREQFLVEPVYLAGEKSFEVTVSHPWITQDPSRKELFRISENATGNDRSATIIFQQTKSSTRDTLYIRQLKKSADNFNRHTDSLAIGELINELGNHFSWYKWPNGSKITDLHSLGIYTDIVDNQRRVTSIKLPSATTFSDLFAIPASLWNLSSLKWIEAYGPYCGEIPAEVVNLKNLQKLIFVNSSISGALPKELGTLPLLESLIIENLDFRKSATPDKTAYVTSVPEELVALKNLKELLLTLDTETFPEVFCRIPTLKSLTIIQKGKLDNHTQPSGIVNLVNLETLKYYSLNHSRTGAPVNSYLFTLPRLATLHICTNDPLPNNISNASSLVSLTVCGTFAELTASGVRLPNAIKELSLDSYLLTAIVDEMITNNLESLSVTANGINAISAKVNQAPRLRRLVWRGDNDAKAPMIYNLSALTNIKQLILERVTGSLREDITKLTNLTHFQIVNSDVEGYINDKMWNFFLETVGKPLADDDPTPRLVLKGNRLTSNVPSSVVKSEAWTSTLGAAAGAWSPNNQIIPQQPGYEIKLPY